MVEICKTVHRNFNPMTIWYIVVHARGDTGTCYLVRKPYLYGQTFETVIELPNARTKTLSIIPRVIHKHDSPIRKVNAWPSNCAAYHARKLQTDILPFHLFLSLYRASYHYIRLPKITFKIVHSHLFFLLLKELKELKEENKV